MNISLSSFVAMYMVSLATMPANGQPLNIDFQPLDASAADTQLGFTAESGQILNNMPGLFTGLNGQPLSLTIEGDSFQMDVFDGAGSAVSMSTRTTGTIANTILDDLLRDSLHDDSNIRIRLRNLDPLVMYKIQFYLHDEEPGTDALNVSYSVVSGFSTVDSQTVSHSGPGNPATVPSIVETTFSSSVGAEGFQVVQFNFSAGGTIYINGFELSVVGSCLADVNGDGMLSPTDFTAWVGAFNNNAPECDQNGDGACTPTDFTAWIGNYNAGC